MKLAFPGRMKEYAAGIQSSELRLVDEPAAARQPEGSPAGAPPPSSGGDASGNAPLACVVGGNAGGTFAPSSGTASESVKPTPPGDAASSRGSASANVPPGSPASTADKFLTAATKEYRAGIIDQPLWARAMAQSNGDRTLTIEVYLRARATALRVDKREKRQQRSARRARALGQLGSGPGADVAATQKDGSPKQAGTRIPKPKRKQVLWIGGTLASLFAVALFMTVRSESDAAQQRTPETAPAAPHVASAPNRGDAVPAVAVRAGEGAPIEDSAARIEELKTAGNWNLVVLYAVDWLRKEPQNSAAWKALANGYVQLRQYREALEAATRVVQIAPDDAAAWRSLGEIHMAAQQPVDALAAFQEAFARDEHDAASAAQIGVLNTQLGRFADAHVAFDKAFSVNPQDMDALCGAESLARKEGRTKDAEGFAHQVTSLDGRCRDINPGQSVRVVAVGASSRSAPGTVR